jgi:hypothetical protein
MVRAPSAFLEEPIRAETPEAYATLRTMRDVPYAIGEEFASKWQFVPYLEGADAVRPGRRLRRGRLHGEGGDLPGHDRPAAGERR